VRAIQSAAILTQESKKQTGEGLRPSIALSGFPAAKKSWTVGERYVCGMKIAQLLSYLGIIIFYPAERIAFPALFTQFTIFNQQRSEHSNSISKDQNWVNF
jgi:hypothetical protein